MLPIYLDISKSIAEKANRNVYFIIELFIESCNSLDYETFLQEIFPEFYLRKNFDKCKEIVCEIKEMTMDSYQRHYLKPIYEYALFMLLEWWIDVTEIDMKMEIPENEIRTSDDEYLAEHINDIEEYKSFMFEDWDFLSVPELFEYYKQDPFICRDFLAVDLDDYIELMPDDIREEYEIYKSELSPKVPADEEYIVRSLFNVIQLLEKRPYELYKYSEVELSNVVQNMLHQSFNEKGLIITREEQSGYASKKTGELDFYIYKYSNNTYRSIAVGENKEWGRFEDSLKQLIGYMDNNTSFGFTIIFNKNTNLQTVLQSRLEILNHFHVNNNFTIIGEIESVYELNNVLKTRHQNPEIDNTYFNVYHFIANSFKPARKESARQARKIQ